MAVKPRSVRQEQSDLVARLRAGNRTWPEIAAEFRDRYGVNMRTAFRLAHGWSQSQAAEQWNARWPAEPKTFKNFSYWERWPAPSGHAPSVEVLIRLAALYRCSVADLLSDVGDFRDADPHHRVRTRAHTLSLRPGQATLVSDRSVQPWEPRDLDAVLAQLQEMDVQEVADMIALWAGDAPPNPARRDLLLRLSAGLTLAAAHPSLAHATEDPAPRRSSRSSLSGVWLSRYLYPSSGRNAEFEGQHYVVLYHRGDKLKGQSLPHSTGSRLSLDLSIEGHVATGTWTERTSPTGYYRGATYHGTLQLLLSPADRALRGKWLGFGKDFQVNSGQWELAWVDGSLSARDLRRYHNKL
ncbi:hypothetical protein [Thermoactinospora rubra]|uniref:hypothetical protein n=1 Tax=Thermoactinospora rubra TaxID=1088767 RepID=UPI000A1230FE|nr:hypothetical protein [Thermoactinospora rubra]